MQATMVDKDQKGVVKMENEVDEYREKIIEMVKDIEDNSIIKLLYYYVQSGYNEEKAGK